MAKKKDKPQIINNIEKLNLEIDYDKLAEAIVKAQEKGESEANKKRKFTSGSFAILVTIAFRIFTVFVGLLSVAMLIAIGGVVDVFEWYGFSNIFVGIVSILMLLIFAVLLGLFAVLLWKSAKEIETEKDRNYIISVFSGIVSFAALIVALVALFKGVG